MVRLRGLAGLMQFNNNGNGLCQILDMVALTLCFFSFLYEKRITLILSYAYLFNYQLRKESCQWSMLNGKRKTISTFEYYSIRIKPMKADYITEIRAKVEGKGREGRR